MYLIRTPHIFQRIFPAYLWRIPTNERVLYLSFDDGPIPKVTPWVLEQLEKYNAKGTFFCVGDNVKRNPLIYRQVLEAGHTVGNHTFNHLNGWQTGIFPYLQNVDACKKVVSSNLFRPPYGRLCRKQSQFLQKDYRIVLWDVLSGDFDYRLDGRQCAQNVIQNATPGSIIVFHDSLKAWKNLQYALPAVLEHFSGLGYRFEFLENRLWDREERQMHFA